MSVIWATQVPDSVAEEELAYAARISGIVSRQRVERVTLKRVEHVMKVLQTLDNIRWTIQSHQQTKCSMLLRWNW